MPLVRIDVSESSNTSINARNSEPNTELMASLASQYRLILGGVNAVSGNRRDRSAICRL
jgi:hypothetical protein